MSNPKLLETLSKTHKDLWIDEKQNIHIMRLFPNEGTAIATSLHIVRTLAKMMGKTVIVNVHYLDDNQEFTTIQQAHVPVSSYARRN